MKLNILKIILSLFFLEKCILCSKEKYANLKKTVESIKKSCGEVCDQTMTGKKGEFFDEIHKKIECKSLFNNPDFDKLSEFETPPKKIPKWLIPEYTYGDRVKVVYDYYDDSKGQPHNLDWSEKMYKIIQDMYDTETFTGSLS